MAATPVPVRPSGTGSIDVSIRGLRNDHGVVRLILCPAGSNFPDCGHAGIAQVATIRNRLATASFHDIAPGDYAVAAFHDENDNGRLDTFLGIPREGFGFSRNPPMRPRAPHFSECDVVLDKQLTADILVKYLF